MSIWGNRIRLETSGGSHAPCVRVRLCGLPEGLPVDEAAITALLSERKSKTGGATERTERDEPKILKGIRQGKTTGEDVVAEFPNADVQSDYSVYTVTPRPSHADYFVLRKSGENAVKEGRYGGRMTVGLVFAGGVTAGYLKQKGVCVSARLVQAGSVVGTDESSFRKMEQAAREAKKQGDSIGGVIECRVTGLPACLGEPPYYGWKNLLSSLLFSIPALVGIEFGSGFSAAERRGSENNDAFVWKNGAVATETNRAGGVIGGYTTGNDVVFRVAMKPAPTVSVPQRTVNLQTGEETTVSFGGRNDVCVAFRAVACVKAAAMLTATELLLREESATISALRAEIDSLDDRLKELYLRRLAVAEQIGERKAKKGLATEDGAREAEILQRLTEGEEKETSVQIRMLWQRIFELSKKRQSEKNKEKP